MALNFCEPSAETDETIQHHVIISGTGRAGTTFLVQLLTELGLDTGFSDPHAKFCDEKRAGMEWSFRKHDSLPYIVKSPGLCEDLEWVLKNKKVAIDHAIIPVRDLYSAAESRRTVARKGRPHFLMPQKVLGFRKWRIRRPKDQENVLAHNFYQLAHTIAEHSIPMTLLFFPRLAKDAEYLFEKIRFLLDGISQEKFVQAFQKISRPELIHDFKTGDSTTP